VLGRKLRLTDWVKSKVGGWDKFKIKKALLLLDEVGTMLLT